MEINPRILLTVFCTEKLRDRIFNYAFENPESSRLRNALILDLARKLNTREKKVRSFPSEKLRVLVLRFCADSVFKNDIRGLLSTFVRNEMNDMYAAILEAMGNKKQIRENEEIIDIDPDNLNLSILLSKIRESNDKDSAKFILAYLHLVSEGAMCDFLAKCIEYFDTPLDEIPDDRASDQIDAVSGPVAPKMDEVSPPASNTPTPCTQIDRTQEDKEQKPPMKKEVEAEINAIEQEETSVKEKDTYREHDYLLKQELATPVSPERMYGKDLFSSLDIVVQKECLGMSQGIDGSLTPEETELLVEEIIRLNARRSKSYFHKGFLDSLRGFETDNALSCLSLKQRGWYVAGFAEACHIPGNKGKIRNLFRTLKDDWDNLCKEPGCIESACISMPLFFKAFWEQSDRTEAVETLSPRVLLIGSTNILQEVISAACDRYRSKDITMTRLLVDKLLSFLDEGEQLGFEIDEWKRLEILRRHAQCLKAEGRFDESIKIFNHLLEMPVGDDKADILTDIGLASGGFHWLSEAEPPANKEDVKALLERLDKGMDFYSEAAKCSATIRTTNTHYVLGIRSLLAEEYESAEKHLTHAYTGACKRSQIYSKTEVLHKAKLYYALSILLDNKQSLCSSAVDRLIEVDKDYSSTHWPEWLVKDAAEKELILGASESEKLANFLHKHFNDMLIAIAIECNIVDSNSPTIMAALKEFVEKGEIPFDKWATVTIKLSRMFDAAGEKETATKLLARFEDEAHKSPAVRWILCEFLSKGENYLGIWDEVEARACLTTLHEISGDLLRAREELRKLFYHEVRTDPDSALGYLEKMEELGEPNDELEKLRTHQKHKANSFRPAVIEVDSVPPSLVGKVLVISCDERLKGQYEHVLRSLKDHPLISTELRVVEWVSSWGKQFESLRRQIKKHDGVVISRFVHTLFGQKVRQECNALNIPWITLTGTGQGLFENAIIKAVKVSMKSKR